MSLARDFSAEGTTGWDFRVGEAIDTRNLLRVIYLIVEKAKTEKCRLNGLRQAVKSPPIMT